jgi:hypothetical protein
MPVDVARTHQPYMGPAARRVGSLCRNLLGSIAAALRVDSQQPAAVPALGLEINANHLRGCARIRCWAGPSVPCSRSTQVSKFALRTRTGALVCISRITMAMIDLPAHSSTHPGYDAKAAPFRQLPWPTGRWLDGAAACTASGGGRAWGRPLATCGCRPGSAGCWRSLRTQHRPASGAGRPRPGQPPTLPRDSRPA